MSTIEDLMRLHEDAVIARQALRHGGTIEKAKAADEVLRSALEAAVPQWRPIAEAPKEGYVLVGNPKASKPWMAGWSPVAVSGYRFDEPWRSALLNHNHIERESQYLPPTHYMPLPPAPRDDKEKP